MAGRKRFYLMMGLGIVLFPYVTTLAWNGPDRARESGMRAEDAGSRRAEGQGETGEKTEGEEDSGRTVVLDRGEESTAVDVEEYLIGLVAAQIPGDYEKETIKAQAILARTYIYRQMGESREIMESALDVDCEEPGNMDVDTMRYIGEAVRETQGITAVYEGALIDPLYHRVSAGSTRDGGEFYPYIKPVECGDDYTSEEFLSEYSWEKEEFAAAVSGIRGEVAPEELPWSIQVVDKDAAGYVTALQIEGVDYTGEEVQFALGLASSAFVFGEENGKVTASVKGSGHGYGFDQYAANEKAKRGWTAEELLKYFYKNIVLISE